MPLGFRSRTLLYEMDTRNYRGISLLCVMYKVLERIILDRLIKHREETMREEQAGFRPDRSTIDQVFMVRRVIEIWQLYSKPMQLRFWTLKPRSTLFIEALFSRRFVRLLDDMSQRTTAAARTPAGCTTPFEVTLCEEQQCPADTVIAPTGPPLTDLEYADDVVIFAESSTKLQHVVNLASKLAASYGLRLRPDKRKQAHIHLIVLLRVICCCPGKVKNLLPKHFFDLQMLLFLTLFVAILAADEKIVEDAVREESKALTGHALAEYVRTHQSLFELHVSDTDILACCGEFCGAGCSGGWPFQAWKWVGKYGVCTGGDYRAKGVCKPYSFHPCGNHKNQVYYGVCPKGSWPTPRCEKFCQRGYIKPYKKDKFYAKKSYWLPNNEKEIRLDIMKNGPVQAAFDVYEDFKLYKRGIYKHKEGIQTGGHAVKIIGWGKDNGTDYWLIANSWSKDWGESGFFRMVRGENNCEIEDMITAGIMMQQPKSLTNFVTANVSALPSSEPGKIEKVLDEGQPCEQAGFRKGFSTIDHIHTVSKLIEISREYKMPLCLTFIDLKKAFDSVETEAVVEALDNQGVPTQYIKVLRELYSNFTTGISPFYKNIIIDVKRGVRQGDTISPKIFTATLENAMRKLEWDDMGVKVDGRQQHHLRFADDIVLVTPSISQAERMLTEFDETCGCIGLQLNLQKTMFMRNGWVSDAPFTLNGTNISECTSYVYLGRELNMMNDLTPELGRRRRAAWGAYKSIEDVVKKTRNTRLRAHLFNTTVLPALTYASETWAFRKQEENAVSVIERAIERVMLGVSRFTQVRDGIRSSLLRQRSKIRDAAAFAKESKIRWAGHVMRFNDNRWTRAVSDWVPRDIKRTTGRPPTRWSDFFTKSLKEKYDALRVPRERRNHWATLARDRDKWKNYWRPLDQFEDQRESRLVWEDKNTDFTHRLAPASHCILHLCDREPHAILYRSEHGGASQAD
ncbi:hypothetical protein RB195_007659 [Necator americanus]|uniref:Reverse transcriptase domain-containing protein n=1 Tax=Necator americanus TaxID=51031 RepID=A0ABR1BYF1_NECAM